MFTVTMAVGNFGIAAGSSLPGVLIDSIGFAGMFIVFGLIHLAILPLIFTIFKRRSEMACKNPTLQDRQKNRPFDKYKPPLMVGWFLP